MKSLYPVEIVIEWSEMDIEADIYEEFVVLLIM